MKNRFKDLSKRTLALFAAAALLLAAGSVTGARAALNVTSSDYDAEFDLSEGLHVTLVEGTGDSKTDVGDSGQLLASLKDENGDQITINPGKKYDETLAASNSTGYSEYVRIVVRKYWLNENGKAATDLDPSLIKLTYNGVAYNDSSWIKSDSESTDETDVYYYRSILAGEAGEAAETAPLFNEVSIDKSILKLVGTEESTGAGGMPVITYKYDYDGYTFGVEADAQAVQTHNAEEAIKSIWGVDVTLSGGNITAVK